MRKKRLGAGVDNNNSKMVCALTAYSTYHFFCENPIFELIFTHKALHSKFLLNPCVLYLLNLSQGYTLLFLFYSGYHSQAVSSNTLSSDDSTSLRSISVDLDTPDIETSGSGGGGGGSKMDPADADETVIDLKKVTSVPTPYNQSGNNINVTNSTSLTDLLSPPDISLTTSISPGEETDATVTITPSSATNTPSQSSEMGKIFFYSFYNQV